MTWTQIADFVKEVGFPIFVAVWMLTRSDWRSNEMTKALTALTLTLELLRTEMASRHQIASAPSKIPVP